MQLIYRSPKSSTVSERSYIEESFGTLRMGFKIWKEIGSHAISKALFFHAEFSVVHNKLFSILVIPGSYVLKEWHYCITCHFKK